MYKGLKDRNENNLLVQLNFNEIISDVRTEITKGLLLKLFIYGHS